MKWLNIYKIFTEEIENGVGNGGQYISLNRATSLVFSMTVSSRVCPLLKASRDPGERGHCLRPPQAGGNGSLPVVVSIVSHGRGALHS